MYWKRNILPPIYLHNKNNNNNINNNIDNKNDKVLKQWAFALDE